jgi:5-oxopent-3-ene-1,2,5-tricarboxylate decarboxylase / 2-hydroxyhepta-2,4-diene-1,7-dioate isomerase
VICNGHIYGVVLNDQQELAGLASEFREKPYLAPPSAPVVFMKPSTTLASGVVALMPETQVTASTTLALLIGRDTTGVSAVEALDCVGASALAIDLSYPQASYYRPAIAQRNSDGFLIMGEWGWPIIPDSLTALVDGKDIHRWSLDRLVRPVPQLIADISAFLTLRAGDVLLVGLPGDAPTVQAGCDLRADATGLASATARIKEYAS